MAKINKITKVEKSMLASVIEFFLFNEPQKRECFNDEGLRKLIDFYENLFEDLIPEVRLGVDDRKKYVEKRIREFKENLEKTKQIK